MSEGSGVAPHDVLLAHFPKWTEPGPGPLLCRCGVEFLCEVDWAWHALGRVGLDGDPYAESGSVPDSWFS